MKFLIRHRIEYAYSERVWLEPTVVRLRPLCNAFQQVTRHQILVSPQPDGTAHLVDLVGNNAQRFWFSGQHHRLAFEASSEVETFRANPFDFLLQPGCEELPFEYDEAMGRLLGVYRENRSLPEVAHLATGVLRESGGQTVDFLVRLAERLRSEIKVRRRPRGDPRQPEKTLKLKEGACRDSAVLFAEVCRSIGLASRFVSGYHYRPGTDRPELHAWCEVYLPGAGWRGFDPSVGLAVDAAYVALAAGPTHHDVRPTQGNFRGRARSRMATSLQIEIV